MLANGRFQVSAPKCNTNNAVKLNAGTATGAADGTNTTIFSTGNTTVGTAAAAAATSLVVAGGAGFLANDFITVGAGLPNEEVAKITAIGTPGQSSVTLTVTALANAHSVGELVINKVVRSIRPGSIIIKNNGAALGGTNAEGTHDNGLGVISGTGLASGTVDYATGAVTVTFSAAATVANTNFATMDCDVLTDSPAIDEGQGRGFFKNFNSMLSGRADIPDHVVMTNLGDTDIGYFIEQSKNDGKSYTTRNLTASGKLPKFARIVVNVPSGSSPVLDGVRIRLGAFSSQTTAFGAGAVNSALVNAGVVDIDMLTATGNNGQ